MSIQPFTAGDIIKQIHHVNMVDFFHVIDVHDNGGMEVISDSTGEVYGLSARFSMLATLLELVNDREARYERRDQ